MQKTTDLAPSISRRAFVAFTGLAGAGMALTGCAPKASEGDVAADAQAEASGFDYDTVGWSLAT